MAWRQIVAVNQPPPPVFSLWRRIVCRNHVLWEQWDWRCDYCGWSYLDQP